MDGKELAKRTWGSSPTGWTAAPEHSPGTEAFFDKALEKRRTYELPWLPDVVPFGQMRGLKVLEVGFGPGFDTLTFHQNGADYEGVDITPENIERTKKHLAYKGYKPKVQQADAENLPFEDGVFDVYFSNGVLHHVPDMSKALAEAYRVLRPGGEAYILVYHRNSIFYRVTLGIWHQIIFGGWRKQSLDNRLREIEANAAGEKPIVNVYSKAEYRNLLKAAGFSSVETCVRKLVVEDLPIAFGIDRLYRRLPPSVFDAVGRLFGWYVVAKAKK